MSKIKEQFTGTELDTILRITQLVLSEVRGFGIPEYKSGLSVSDLMDLKRKIERALGIPSMPLVDASIR